MAKKRSAPPAAPEITRVAVTPERFVRLYRLLELLAAGPQTRAVLIRRLHLDVRGFYRDLELLRAADIHVTLADGRYSLAGDISQLMERLPFPDPHLTLGEARALARGRGRGQTYLRQMIERLLA
jgi:hypothetical protein